MSYDSIGNVLTYGTKSYTWADGRNLSTITDSSNNDSISYTYNRYGYRTGKTVNGVATNFIVDEDGTVVAQKTGNDTLYFEYDNYGSPLGFVYNGVQYLYITNIRNDVIAITDTTGTVVAGYTYGDWGECTVDSTSTNLALANLNPLRYRGYYYDNETGYYYLQSRYYDPSICRFINADLPEYAKVQKNEQAGINLFVYCCNDPVNNSDPTGFVMSYAIKQAILGSVLGFVAQRICDIISYKFHLNNTRWSGIGTYVSTILGSAIDAVVKKGIVKTVLLAIGKNMFEQVLNRIFHKTPVDYKLVLNAAFDAIVNYIISNFLKIKSPKFIRDIKDEAHNIGIKGTVELTKYLEKKIYKVNLSNIALSKYKTVLKSIVIDVYKVLYA